MSQINLLTASLFVALFVFQTLRHRQFAWLALSTALFIAVQWYFLHDLSRPAYILIGSLAYRHPRQPENGHHEHNKLAPSATPSLYLTSLIHANLAMHLAFFILIGCAWIIYPYGISPHFIADLYQIYALDPTAWLSFTAFLMLLTTLYLVLFRQPENCKPGRRQLSVSVLLALAMQAHYIRQTLIDLFAQFQ